MRRTFACLSFLTAVAGVIHFSETFDDSWESRWVKSTWKEDEGMAGDFVLSTGRWFADQKEDRGLMTSTGGKFYAISASFDSFSNEGKDLIIQFQLKYEEDQPCGGGYLKIGPTMHDGGKEFGNPTPYHIMFGPDKCGYGGKTQLIFHYNGSYVEKRTDIPYRQEPHFRSHLYRLVLKPDNMVYVDIDGEEFYEGSLKEDWDTLPPKVLEDKEDKRPYAWADQAIVDDFKDKKPADWEDEARILDMDARKPLDWNDEEDGEWVRPHKHNPLYKGFWNVRRIPNPVYKGIWEPKKYPNPEFVDDPFVYKYDDIGFVGIDIWQYEAKTIFDNIIITDDIAEADALIPKWRAIHKAESEAELTAEKATEVERKKEEEKKEHDIPGMYAVHDDDEEEDQRPPEL